MTDITCTYTIYLQAPADRVWQALTDENETGKWWGHRNISDWQAGSTWVHARGDGEGDDGGGTVLVSERPSRLSFTFPTGEPSTVSFDIDEYESTTRLVMVHSDLPSEEMRGVVARVWPAILSNLKTYVETGDVMRHAPLQTL